MRIQIKDLGSSVESTRDQRRQSGELYPLRDERAGWEKFGLTRYEIKTAKCRAQPDDYFKARVTKKM